MTRKVQFPSCQTEQLLLYHYGELGAAGHRQVEQHLQHCPACQTELATMRTVLKAVPTVPTELSPAEIHRFSARVMERLPPRRHPYTRPVLGWALAGMTVALLLTVNQQKSVLTPTLVPTGIPQEISAEKYMLPDLELLQNLELLENLELLQQLEEMG
jgi:anti-sigma factor RsiW